MTRMQPTKEAEDSTVPKVSFVPEDLMKMRFVGTPRLSPSGDKCAFVFTSLLEKENAYTSSIWLFDGTRSRQITNFSEKQTGRDTNPRWSPDGRRLAFLSGRSGSQQIWVLDLSGGEAFQLTSMPKGTADFRWAPDGSAIFFSAKEEAKAPKMRQGSTARRITRLRYKFNGTGYLDDLYTQVWMVRPDSLETKRLTQGPYNCGTPVPSPDGKRLAFISTRTDDETARYSDLWVLDLQDNCLTKATRSAGAVGSFTWAADSASLYYLGHEKGVYPGGYPEIRRVVLDGLEQSVLSSEFPFLIGGGIGGDARFDAGETGLILGQDGETLYFSAVDGGSSYVYALNSQSGDYRRVFGDGQMVVSSYDVSCDTLVVNKATPSTPGDLWLSKFERGISPEQITRFNDELFKDRYIAWPHRIEFHHPDGTLLEGWVMKPRGYEEGRRYPLVMEIHGGPHTTYGNSFFHEFQILTGHGIGVVYTNPRGSMGYGEDFARAVVGDWCGVDARDLEFMASESLKIVSWADPSRFGVTGGSQGGYFTNWLIGHTDLFAAAVTQRSMSNLYSKYGVSDIGWSGDRAGMGGHDLWTSEDFIMERSPIRYAPNVKTPTLIIHSDMDFRCPLEQGEQWYVALKRLGVTVEMLLFHGENHELSRSGKPANRLVRLDAILEWFQRFLVDEKERE